MTNNERREVIRQIKVENVRSVYSGKNGYCCCGCAGKHSYASAHVAAASVDRGYEVTADEVNDRMVAKVVKLIQAHADNVDFDNDDMFALVVGKRLYIAYMMPNYKD